MTNERTVNSLAQYEAEEEGGAEQNNQEHNYTSYDLNEIYPFLILKAKDDDNLLTIADRTHVSADLLAELNGLSVDDKSLQNKNIIVPDRVPHTLEGLRELTVGDLMEGDFDSLLLRVEPPTFLVQYYTVKGVALGKLTLTDYEIIFEPLNPKLKGFINQESNLKSR